MNVNSIKNSPTSDVFEEAARVAASCVADVPNFRLANSSPKVALAEGAGNCYAMTVLGAARIASRQRKMLVLEGTQRTKNPHYSLFIVDQKAELGASIDYYENKAQKEDLSGKIKYSPKVKAIDCNSEMTNPGTRLLLSQDSHGILGSLVLYSEQFSEVRLVHKVPDPYMSRQLDSFDRSRLIVDYDMGIQVLRDTPKFLFECSMKLVKHMAGQLNRMQ